MSSAESHQRDRLVACFGAFLSTAALVSYFTLSVKLPSLRDSAWLNLVAVAAGLAISIAAVLRRRSVWSTTGLALSIVMATALFGFVYVLSNRLPPATATVGIGEIVPAFDLPDHRGLPVALSDFAGSNVVLVFFRGFW